MFHLSDNLYFGRTAGGGVRLIKIRGEKAPPEYPQADGTRPNPYAELDVEIDASGWASVVAGVSERGETGATYREALDWHNKKELPDCPHAAPFRYCPECKADPCPIGLERAAPDHAGG